MIYSSFDDLYEKSRRFFRFEELVNNFTRELTKVVTSLTCNHFFARNPLNRMPKYNRLILDRIRQAIQKQEYFRIFGYMIVKEVELIKEAYAESDMPSGKPQPYQKHEYTVYDNKMIKKELHDSISLLTPATAKQKAGLKQIIAREIAEREYDQEYEKILHKELKKLTLQFFPEITEISGNGLRQIDYMLQDYARRIHEQYSIIRREIRAFISSPSDSTG